MIEQKVSETILQKPFSVKIGEKEYQAAPPTAGTLILVSEIIGQIPNTAIDKENPLGEVFQRAKYIPLVAKAIATMILGAEAILFPPKSGVLDTFSSFFRRKKEKVSVEVLANEILHKISVQEMATIFFQLLQKTQATDFFTLITFLSEANMLKPTKKVSETTAFGRSLGAS